MEQPTSGYYQDSYEFESHKGSEQLGQFGQCIDQGHIENSVNEHNSRSRIAREYNPVFLTSCTYKLLLN